MTLRLEALRVVRSRRPLVTGLAILLFVGLMLLGFYTYALTETKGRAEFRYTFESRSYFNGLLFSVYAFWFGFLLVLPVFAAAEGAAQIAGDTQSGAMRLMLTRPVSRARLFFAKFALATAMAWISVAALLAVTLGAGLVFVGWGDLDLYPGVLRMTDRHQHLEQGEALWRFALAWPAAGFALCAPLAMSLLVAVFARSAVNAVAASIAVYLVLYVIAEVHFFRELRPFLFTSYLSFWRELFREEIPWARVGADALRLCGFSALFLALAFGRFRRREELA